MAQRYIIEDDLDQSPDARTHEFSLDGQTWEIDLAEGNLKRLKDFLDEFIDASRKVRNGKPVKTVARAPRVTAPTSGNTAEPRSTVSATDAERNAAIRAWASDSGIDVAPRGQIPKAVRAQYEAALSGAVTPAAAESPTTTPEAASHRGPKGSTRPPAQEIVDLANQLRGTSRGWVRELANELGVKTTNTAKSWLADAQKELGL